MGQSPESTPFGHPQDPIIIVDDEPDDAYLLRRYLRAANISHPVVTFSNGRNAIEYLIYLSGERPPLRPCVLFTDLRMAPMDGFQLIGWIRSQPQFAAIRMLALSGSAYEHEVQKALSLGADLYMQKFPKPDALRDLLLPNVADRRTSSSRPTDPLR